MAGIKSEVDIEAGAVRTAIRNVTAVKTQIFVAVVAIRFQVVAEVEAESKVEVRHLVDPIADAHRPHWSGSGLIVLLTTVVVVHRESLTPCIDPNLRLGCRERAVSTCRAKIERAFLQSHDAPCRLPKSWYDNNRTRPNEHVSL